MIWRSLWRRRTRTLLTAAGIAVGVAAVVAMGGMAEGINRNYGGIIGTSNDLLVTQVNAFDTMFSTLDEDLGPRLERVPGVARVEPGLFTFVSVEDLQFFMIFGYDPGTVAVRHYRIVEGKPVTSAKQMALGRRAADALKKRLGDTLHMYGIQYRIVGIYETGQGLEESGGVVTLADAQTIARRPRKVSLFQVSLQRGAIAGQVIGAIERLDKNIAASKASEYEGSKQWTGLMQGFAWGISAIAIIIGGLGMMNAMVMSVLERTREIGTLRALGWGRGRVLGLVMQESLALGLAGGTAGMALGAWLTKLAGLVPGLGSFLEGVVTPGILAQGLLTALALGLVGGLYPAWTAANLQPVEALRYEGGSGGASQGRLARAGGQSFRNLWRRRNRTLIAAAGIGVGVAALVTLGSITRGLMGQLNQLAGSGGTSNITVMQRDTADSSLSSLDEGMVAQLRAMPGVKNVSPLLLGFISGQDSLFFILSGVDPNSAGAAHYRVVAGRALRRPNEILLGKVAAKNYKLGLGDALTLYSTRYRVVGIYETGLAWEDGGGLVTLREAQRLLNRPRSVGYISVDVQSPADAPRVIEAINTRFGDARATLSSEFAQNMRDMQQSQAMVDAIGALALLIGGIVVANTMIMSMHERTREIGTLRAMGWTQRAILAQVAQETLWLCLLAGILGTVLGACLIWLIVRLPGADALLAGSWDPAASARAVVLALVVGLVAGAYPAWRASRLQPVEALRYE